MKTMSLLCLLTKPYVKLLCAPHCAPLNPRRNYAAAADADLAPLNPLALRQTTQDGLRAAQHESDSSFRLPSTRYVSNVNPERIERASSKALKRFSSPFGLLSSSAPTSPSGCRPPPGRHDHWANFKRKAFDDGRCRK